MRMLPFRRRSLPHIPHEQRQWQPFQQWQAQAYYPVGSFPTVATFTSLNSLGSSGTFLSGAECTRFDNTSNLWENVFVEWWFKTGTNAPTANTQVNLYAYMSSVDPQSTAIDVLDGTDSAETITNAGILTSALRLIDVIAVTATTTSLVYPGHGLWLAQFFGGVIAPFFGFYIAHNIGQNAASSGSGLQVTGVKF